MAFDRRELRAFLAVLDAGSLGRAAEFVHLSQPALSRLIQAMEVRFGQPLFERQTRGMQATPAGEVLAPHARLLLAEMDMATDALEALRGVKRGVVRLGAVAAVSRSVIPDSIAALLEVAPDLRVEVLEAPDDRLVAALLGREIDLMIASDLPRDETFRPIAECRFDDVYSVFCSTRHPLATQHDAGLDHVLAERWVMPREGTTPRVLLEQILHRADRSMPVISVESGSPDAMVAYVARTKLLGWLPRPLLAAEHNRGKIHLLPVKELPLTRRFFAYQRRRGLLPAAVVELLKVLPLVGEGR